MSRPAVILALPATEREGVTMRGLRTLLIVAYIVVGIIIAANRKYLTSLDSIREIISAVLAIALWPLVLLGVNVRIRG